MPLGIDATIQYGVGSWRALTARDLRIKGGYNTRTHRGLPPTPICNPGLASLKAAAHPAKVNYLYYVAIPGDTKRRHHFSRTFADFQHFQETHPPESELRQGETTRSQMAPSVLTTASEPPARAPARS